MLMNLWACWLETGPAAPGSLQCLSPRSSATRDMPSLGTTVTLVQDERTKADRKQRKKQQTKLKKKSTKIEGQLAKVTADFKAKERECDDLIVLQKQNVKAAQAELSAAQEK